MYLQNAPTKELADLRVTQINRIHNLNKKLKNKTFTNNFPNENEIKEAIQFEKREMNVLMNELNKRQDIAVLTIKVDLINEWGISFYNNISFWEDWIYQYLEEDFGISHNRTMEIETFFDTMEEHGYKITEKKCIISTNSDELIQALLEGFSS